MEEKESATSVYVLIDPRDGMPRYFGISSSPEARYRSHCNPKEVSGTPEKGKWVAELRQQKLKPTFKILKTFTGTFQLWEAKAMEDDLIWEHTARGIKLFHAEVESYWVAKEKVQAPEFISSAIAEAQEKLKQAQQENYELKCLLQKYQTLLASLSPVLQTALQTADDLDQQASNF